MDGWWWLPIGLIAWSAVAMAMALWLGPVLRSCSQPREALDSSQGQDASVPRRPLRHWRQAAS